ncbi:MAG: sigma-70 family RNA polymerase sigma factor [Actinomycetota bacterium]
MIEPHRIKQFEQVSDTEIIAKVLGGETILYEVIIRRYNSYLYKTGRTYAYNHQDTEDLMQETYINAFTNLQKFENRSSFKTWITKIMLNNCFQKKKKYSFQKEIPTEFKPHENYQQMFINPPPDADKNILIKELNRVLENALQQIPTDYRMVFSLRELNGLSVTETSEALEISENNVKVRLNRARKMLRNEIEKMYSPEDIYQFNLIYCDKMVKRVMSIINNQ